MHHAARLPVLLLLGFAASIGNVGGVFFGDVSPPICSALPESSPTPKVDGTATELSPGDVGISSVALDIGAVNLTLNVPAFTPGATNVTFSVTQTSAGVDASGTVVVQDGQGHACTVPVRFVTLGMGVVNAVELCSGEGNSLEVTNNVSQPGGTSVCSSVVLPSAEPGLPERFVPSPPDDASGCRSMTVAAPISGTTEMVITKDGAFNPGLGFMFSKFNGLAFPAFTLLPTTVEAGSTKVKATGDWSLVKMACAEAVHRSAPALSPWATLLLALLLLASATWLVTRRARRGA